MCNMIKMETPLGAVEISQDYFANLVGHAASECFGVAGMIESTALPFKKRRYPGQGCESPLRRQWPGD